MYSVHCTDNITCTTDNMIFCLLGRDTDLVELKKLKNVNYSNVISLFLMSPLSDLLKARTYNDDLYISRHTYYDCL